MFWKVLILFFIINILTIHCQTANEEPDEWGDSTEPGDKPEPDLTADLRKQLNCTDNPKKWCNLNGTDSGCLEGYQCYDIGIQNYQIGMCFRDKQNCRPENSPCCDNTDCCRQVSDTNTAPLDCVQTYQNKLICKVLVV